MKSYTEKKSDYTKKAGSESCNQLYLYLCTVYFDEHHQEL